MNDWTYSDGETDVVVMELTDSLRVSTRSHSSLSKTWGVPYRNAGGHQWVPSEETARNIHVWVKPLDEGYAVHIRYPGHEAWKPCEEWMV